MAHIRCSLCSVNCVNKPCIYYYAQLHRVFIFNGTPNIMLTVLCHANVTGYIIQRDLDVSSSSVPKKCDGTSNMGFGAVPPPPSKLCWNRGYIYIYL